MLYKMRPTEHVAPGARLEIEYLEMQLEVRLGAVEIFGPSIHPGFGGNMFSGPHLVEHLPTISKIVRSTYDHLAHGA